MGVEEETARRVVGGVDTHKDLHVAAVVDEQDRILGTRCFATTRQGYRQRPQMPDHPGPLHVRTPISRKAVYGTG
jgi:hypothetical protein